MVWITPKTWSVGETLTAANFNTHIRDNLNTVVRSVPKTADETVTSSTALQDDDHLASAMAANEYYSVYGVLWTSNAAEVGHLKIAFTVPASATYMVTAQGLNTSGVFQEVNVRSVADTSTWFSPASGSIVTFRGVVVCAGTAGNFTLQWAQAVSNGTGTIVKKGSHLLVSKLG